MNPALLTPGRGGAAGAGNLHSGLIAFWNMEEASGTRADSAGSGLDLSTSGATGNAAGQLGNAWSGDGAATHFLFRTSPTQFLPGATTFFVSGWMKFVATGDMTLAGVYLTTGNQRCWRIRCNSTPRFNFSLSQDGAAATDLVYASVIPTTGQFYNVQAWKTGTTVSMRVNTAGVMGPIETTTLSGATLFASTAALTVGAHDVGNGASRMNGLIDALGYWNRVLTGREQNNLYLGGVGRQYPLTG